jgi:eukaryotic-like serine/threonine-protein kinase
VAVTREYRLGPRIGQGGMADVYLAVQAGPEQFAKLVVQKRVRGVAARRPDFGRRFLAEARLLARLSHPNLVQVLDLGGDERGPFVVVEYLSGETLATALREMVAARRGIPWPVVTRVAAGLAAGLAAAHRACNADGRADPILHRDLTPSNVVVCYSGAVKIIDFGIAKLAAEAGDTRTGMIKGKLSYLAPELLRGATASPASDLFQLGVTLFESLTGRRLFEAPSDAARVQAVLHRPIPAPGDTVSGLPAALDRIVLQLLAREPSQRFGDADLVRAELEEVLRRSGQHIGEHEVGAWLRAALPQFMSERLRMERECLRALTPAREPPEAEVMEPPPARGRRIALAASAAALLAASVVAVAMSSGEAAGPRVEPAAPPIVSPLAAAPEGRAVPAPDAGPAQPADAAPPAADAGRIAPRVRRRRARRPRAEASDPPIVFIPLHPRVAPQPDAGSSAGPDAGAMEPRTDNLDPWSR